MMGKDYEKEWLEILKKASQTLCLRCGECCYVSEVKGVPGYEQGVKPEREQCIHLRLAEIIKGKWRQASCKIHDKENYPKECSISSFGLVGPCLLGMAIWRERQKRKPNVALPDLVTKTLKELSEKSG